MKHKRSYTIYLLIISKLSVYSLLLSCTKDDKVYLFSSKCFISNLIITREAECVDGTNIDIETTAFLYDSFNRITKWEFEEDDYLLFKYNSKGQLVKIQEHYDDKELDYLHFTWESNKITMHFPSEDESSSTIKIIELNSKNEVLRVDYYGKHENDWILKSYEILKWQDGNIVEIERFFRENLKKSSGAKNNIFSGRFRFKKNTLHNKSEIKSEIIKSNSNNFVLRSKTYFTYDNKHNPLSMHQALRLLALEDMVHVTFLSKNNMTSWSTIAFCCTEEPPSTTIFSWEYNFLNYPDRLIYESHQDDDCLYALSWEFVYRNCD